MATTATTTAAAPILAIDLGKDKSTACIQRSASDVKFHTVTTSRVELSRLIDRHRPGVVLLEAGRLAGWVHDLCADKGIQCLAANTASEAWKFKHLQRKTDRDDARRLAEIDALGKFPTAAVPAKEVREKWALIELRQKLVGRRVAVQNRIRAILLGQGLAAPRGPRRGRRSAWQESPSTPSRSPTVTRSNCGAAGCTWR